MNAIERPRSTSTETAPVATASRETRRAIAAVIAYLARPCGRAYLLAVSLVLPITYTYIGWRHTGSIVDEVVAAPGPDDWQKYKWLALSIAHGDIWMSVLPEPYARPGGFLYNYFIAGVFRLLGEDSVRVYLVQTFLLGVTIALMFALYRRRLSLVAGLAYVVLLSVSLYFDFYYHYVWRLLSENLFLPLVPASLLLLFAAQTRASVWLGLGAGAVLGLAVLTRPNIVGFAATASVLLTWYGLRQHSFRRAALAAGAFTAGWVALLALEGLRDYMVVGQFGLATLTHTRDWLATDGNWMAPIPDATPLMHFQQAADFVGRKVLFSLGYTPALGPTFQARPHWIAAWLCLAIYVVIQLRSRRVPEFWEAVTYAFIVLYVLPLDVVGQIYSYGFRMIVPAIPFVLVFPCRLLDLFLSRLTARSFEREQPRLAPVGSAP